MKKIIILALSVLMIAVLAVSCDGEVDQMIFDSTAGLGSFDLSQIGFSGSVTGAKAEFLQLLNSTNSKLYFNKTNFLTPDTVEPTYFCLDKDCTEVSDFSFIFTKTQNSEKYRLVISKGAEEVWTGSLIQNAGTFDASIERLYPNPRVTVMANKGKKAEFTAAGSNETGNLSIRFSQNSIFEMNLIVPAN